MANNRPIGLMVRVFAIGPGDLGSIPGRVIPKTQKMVLDASLLNIQHYKVRIHGKWSNPGKGVAPSLHLDVVAIEKGAFGSPSTMVSQFTHSWREIVRFMSLLRPLVQSEMQIDLSWNWTSITDFISDND